MKKELVFSAKLDSADFIKEVEGMQKRLQSVYQQADFAKAQNSNASRARGAGMDDAGFRQQYQQSTQFAKREQDRTLREALQGQERLGKELTKQWDKERQITQELQKQNKSTEEKVRLEQQLSAVQDEARRKQAQFMQTQKLIDQSGGGGGRGGFFGGGVSGKNIAGGLGAFSLGASLIDNYGSLPQQISRANASSTQSLLGGSLGDISKGNVVGLSAFSDERRRAAQMATDRLKYSETAGAASSLGSGTVGIIKSFGGGSLTPEQTKASNLLASTILGAIGSALKPLEMATGANPIKRWANTYQTAYQSQLIQEYGGDFQKNFEAEKAKNPLKNLAVDYMQNNYQSDLSNQRRMGLSDNGYYGAGGFLERGNMAGFSGDLLNQASMGIAGAGGSTRAMTGSSLMGLRASRGMDMTNASSLLGQISSGAGSSQATNTLFQKLLEDSVRAGLDTSEYREEARKYGEIQASVLGRSGATSGSDAQMLLERLGSFMGRNPTNRGIEGANSAYNEAQSFSGEAGGRGGGLQFAAMMKDPTLRKLGPKGIAGFTEMQSQDITTNNPYIVQQATKINVTPEKLATQLLKMKRDVSMTTNGLDPQAQDALSKYLDSKNLDMGSLTPDQIKAMPKELQSALFSSGEAVTNKFGYGGTQKRTAAQLGFINSGKGLTPGAGGSSAYSGQVEQELGAGPGRSNDEVVKSTGVAAQAMLENFRSFKDAITPASDALDGFTKKIIQLAAAVALVPDADKPAMGKYIGQQLGTMNSGNKVASPPLVTKPKAGS